MIRTTAALGILATLAGCASQRTGEDSYRENPFGDVTTVAVLPFMNHSAEPAVPVEEFGEIFASEILKFRGFRVVRPRAVAETMREDGPIRTFEDAVRIGRGVNADAFIVAAVTDYDPYRPPRLGVSIQFLRTAARRVSDAEIDVIVRSASWRRGPLPMGRAQAGHWVSAFERVYDAHQDSVRRELSAYGEAHVSEDSPFREGAEFVAVQSRFMQFVSNRVIHDVLASAE